MTNEVIINNTENINIARQWGNLSPYEPSPGFGAEEYALPAVCSIKQVNWLQRHGARYPTADASTATLAAALKNATFASFTGSLSFLNGFSYKLGAEILTPVGRQQMFDAGVQAFYQYRYLYNSSAPKIVARTTSQDRILKSAEYWLSGMWLSMNMSSNCLHCKVSSVSSGPTMPI